MAAPQRGAADGRTTRPARDTVGLRRMSRFVVIGVLNTALDFGIFALLEPHLGLIPSTIVSTGVAMVFSYIANAIFAFGATQPTWKSAAQFFGFNALNFWIIQPAVIEAIAWALRSAVHADYPRALLAKLGATAVSMVISFLVYDRYIWPRTSVRQR